LSRMSVSTNSSMSSETKVSSAPNGNVHQNGNTTLSKMTLSEIRDDMPAWKKQLLQKKNDEIMAKLQKQKESEEKEKQKYANVPSWKAEIMKKKEGEKRKQEELERQKEEEKVKQQNVFNMKPNWQQELIKRRNSYQGNTA